MPMKNPPHPGGFVLRQCIEPLGLSITDAAAALGVTRTTLSELVNEKRGISPEMAVRLSKVFGGSAESWLIQQAQYDLAHVHADRLKLKRLELVYPHSPKGSLVQRSLKCETPDAASRSVTVRKKRRLSAAGRRALIEATKRHGEAFRKVAGRNRDSRAEAVISRGVPEHHTVAPW
jgi:antitoxin HigA-1